MVVGWTSASRNGTDERMHRPGMRFIGGRAQHLRALVRTDL
jgi:hypothetical protein